MQILFANNAVTTLAAPISASATSLTLATGTGSLFPNPSVGSEYFLITLVDAATRSVYEIVQCTEISGDICTIVRAQEGTSAKSWLAGDYANNFWTSGSIYGLGYVTKQGNNTFTGYNSYFPPVAPTSNPTIDATYSGKWITINSPLTGVSLQTPSLVGPGVGMWITNNQAATITLTAITANTIIVDVGNPSVSSYVMEPLSRGFLYCDGNLWMYSPSQERVIGNPSGGDKGEGTLNVANGMYVNGNLQTFSYGYASGTSTAITFTSLCNCVIFGMALADSSVGVGFGQSNATLFFSTVQSANNSAGNQTITGFAGWTATAGASVTLTWGSATVSAGFQIAIIPNG